MCEINTQHRVDFVNFFCKHEISTIFMFEVVPRKVRTRMCTSFHKNLIREIISLMQCTCALQIFSSEKIFWHTVSQNTTYKKHMQSNKAKILYSILLHSSPWKCENQLVYIQQTHSLSPMKETVLDLNKGIPFHSRRHIDSCSFHFDSLEHNVMDEIQRQRTQFQVGHVSKQTLEDDLHVHVRETKQQTVKLLTAQRKQEQS